MIADELRAYIGPLCERMGVDVNTVTEVHIGKGYRGTHTVAIESIRDSCWSRVEEEVKWK